MVAAHPHGIGIGLGGLTLDLSQTAPREEALAAIARFSAENPSRPWILGRGWNQEKWGLGRFPTAAELDVVVSDRPVWLARVDGQAGWANSLAPQRAGISADTATHDSGRIIRTHGSPEPAGLVVVAPATPTER